MLCHALIIGLCILMPSGGLMRSQHGTRWVLVHLEVARERAAMKEVNSLVVVVTFMHQHSCSFPCICHNNATLIFTSMWTSHLCTNRFGTKSEWCCHLLDNGTFSLSLNHVVPLEIIIENIVVTLTNIVPKDGGTQFVEWLLSCYFRRITCRFWFRYWLFWWKRTGNGNKW
jgi:hypothetical protein